MTPRAVTTLIAAAGLTALGLVLLAGREPRLAGLAAAFVLTGLAALAALAPVRGWLDDVASLLSPRRAPLAALAPLPALAILAFVAPVFASIAWFDACLAAFAVLTLIAAARAFALGRAAPLDLGAVGRASAAMGLGLHEPGIWIGAALATGLIALGAAVLLGRRSGIAPLLAGLAAGGLPPALTIAGAPGGDWDAASARMPLAAFGIAALAALLAFAAMAQQRAFGPGPPA